jgi:hypothetical protein
MEDVSLLYLVGEDARWLGVITIGGEVMPPSGLTTDRLFSRIPELSKYVPWSRGHARRRS